MCKGGKIKEAKEFFSRLSIDGIQPDARTYTILINGLCREGLLDEAYGLFRTMEKNSSGAMTLIREMVNKGFSADAATLELVVQQLQKDGPNGRFLRELIGSRAAV
ncbi:Putative pentatricopeptide repeat-containing protein At1g12700, mitochondrial [Linum grandiflorum]